MLDEKAVFNPFGVGPRACIGQALAWTQMRIILAKLFWNFDFEIPEGSAVPEWTSQKVYWAWNRVPLEVCIRKAQHPHITGVE